MGHHVGRPFFKFGGLRIATMIQVHADVWGYKLKADTVIVATFNGGDTGAIIAPGGWIIGLGRIAGHRIKGFLLAMAYPVRKYFQFFRDVLIVALVCWMIDIIDKHYSFLAVSEY